MTDPAHDSAETQNLLDQVRAGTAGAVAICCSCHRGPAVRGWLRSGIDPRLAARIDPSDVVQEAPDGGRSPAGRLPGVNRHAVSTVVAADRLRTGWLMLCRHRHCGPAAASAARRPSRSALPDESSRAFARQPAGDRYFSERGGWRRASWPHAYGRPWLNCPRPIREIVGCCGTSRVCPTRKWAHCSTIQPATASQEAPLRPALCYGCAVP